MPAAAQRRALLVSGSAVLFASVFIALALWERPGLGIGHIFYVAIALLALAAGPRVGAAGGVLGGGLYVAGVLINPHVSSATVISAGTVIRTLTFVTMGTVLGWFAQNNRKLVGELKVLSQRDVLTGLPNTRAFEAAITRRLEAGEPFALLLCDVDALMRLNHDHGHAHGNDELRALADGLEHALRPGDEIARIGGDEFAILAAAATADEAAHLAQRLEALASTQTSVTFGWSSFPQDGVNALSLFRAADERLYARKFVHGRRLGEPHLQAVPRTG